MTKGDSVLALIDTDPGIDDALALLYAWGSPGCRLAGLTPVAGIVEVADATRNLFRLLALRRPAPIPVVAQGAARPLARALVTAKGYHGEGGLGGLLAGPPVETTLSDLDGADFTLDALRRARETLTLIALGPLTNVALALARDRVTLGRVSRLVIMGGAIDVPGNVTATAEFNLHVDPEAAAQVLEAGLPIDLVSLDATRQALLPRGDLEATLARRPGPFATRCAAFTLRGARGGKGANQAVAARRLGGEVRLIACVGDDASGREVKTALAGEGIAVEAIATTSSAATGTALIVVDAEGRNQIAVAPGANRALTPAD